MEMKRDAALKAAATKQAQSIVPQSRLDPVSWLTSICGVNVVQFRASKNNLEFQHKLRQLTNSREKICSEIF